MKVLIACDSFKGSLSSFEVASAIEKGIRLCDSSAEIITIPFADGGEGTVDALSLLPGARPISVTVSNPLGKPVSCKYIMVEESKTAIIETACACGITLINEAKRNPLYTTTYGVGEIILDAVKNGARNFILGIGGSATTDAGVGMLKALGFNFFDKKGNSVYKGGEALPDIVRIDDAHVPSELRECNFTLACDVDNPLYGPDGAAFGYSPQKGADKRETLHLDTGLRSFSDVVAEFLGKDCSDVKGAGAAGGLSFAFLSFLNAGISPGGQLIMKLCGFEDIVREVDLVITGEGKIDFQTTHGKAPAALATLAKKYKKPVIAFAGIIENSYFDLDTPLFDACFSILNQPLTLDLAMDKDVSMQNLIYTAAEVFKLLNL